MDEAEERQRQTAEASGGIVPRSPRLAPLIPDRRAVGREVAVGWMWNSALAGALGFAAAWPTFLLSDRLVSELQIVPLGNSINPISLVSLSAAGLVMGAVVGAIQARHLTTYLSARACVWWVVATALAGVLTGSLGRLWSSQGVFGSGTIFGSPLFTSLIIAYVIAGTLFGSAQWMVLRSYLPRAGSWVAASAGGAAAGAILTILVLISPLSVLVVTIYYCIGIPFFLLLGASSFLLLGAATGFVLANLLRTNNKI